MKRSWNWRVKFKLQSRFFSTQAWLLRQLKGLIDWSIITWMNDCWQIQVKPYSGNLTEPTLRRDRLLRLCLTRKSTYQILRLLLLGSKVLIQRSAEVKQLLSSSLNNVITHRTSLFRVQGIRLVIVFFKQFRIVLNQHRGLRWPMTVGKILLLIKSQYHLA